MEPLFGVFPAPRERQDAAVELVLLADRSGSTWSAVQDHPYQRRHRSDAWTLLSYIAGAPSGLSPSSRRRWPTCRCAPGAAGQVGPPARPAERRPGRARAGAGAFWKGIGAWGGPVRGTRSPSLPSLKRSGSSAASGPPSAGHQRDGRALPDARAHSRAHAPRTTSRVWLGGHGPRRCGWSGASPTGGSPLLPRLPLDQVLANQGRDRRGRAQGGPRPRRRSGGSRTSTAHRRRDHWLRAPPTTGSRNRQLVRDLRFDGFVAWFDDEDQLRPDGAFATEVVPAVRDGTHRRSARERVAQTRTTTPNRRFGTQD
jgi:hypothetical protein